MLEFSISNQTLTRLDEMAVVSDSVNYLDCHFTFSPDWEGVTPVATFGHSEVAEPITVMIVDGVCRVPWEVIKPYGFYMAVYGSGETGEGAFTHIPTDTVTVEVAKSGVAEKVGPVTPTPDMYDTLLAEIRAQAEAAATAKTSAQASAQAASGSERAALNARNAAQTAAQVAEQKRSAAISAQLAAEQAAQEAEKWATNAAQAGQEAIDAAEQAARASDEAGKRAAAAAVSAQSASDSAQSALDSAQDAADTKEECFDIHQHITDIQNEVDAAAEVIQLRKSAVVQYTERVTRMHRETQEAALLTKGYAQGTAGYALMGTVTDPVWNADTVDTVSFGLWPGRRYMVKVDGRWYEGIAYAPDGSVQPVAEPAGQAEELTPETPSGDEGLTPEVPGGEDTDPPIVPDDPVVPDDSFYTGEAVLLAGPLEFNQWVNGSSAGTQISTTDASVQSIEVYTDGHHNARYYMEQAQAARDRCEEILRQLQALQGG